jgi:glycerol uptake facilitator-like aquaporin
LAAETLGTAMLLCTVVGSGIMAERLSGGNAAIALLANTLATVFALIVLIETLGPISGAQFNPVVTVLLGPPNAVVRAFFLAFSLLSLGFYILRCYFIHSMSVARCRAWHLACTCDV